MTNQQYDEVVQSCKDIFLKKASDYGTSWRVLRPISIMDQIFIKAQRIRTIQETKTNKVGEDITGEFMAMVNYGIIGLIQMDKKDATVEDLPVTEVERLYNQKIGFVKNVMEAKNHDYGEAWRSLSQESLVDLILVKLIRIRQILQNDGKTIISEGIDANYVDIINYSIFALILIREGKHQG
ncbi:DUF1599 domain-containing protein [Pseudobacter ginsenosidimutans]|uniref:Uncharacterized protein DUF1599 n=1 Tax=Pseudobacter ginsenosidimutans TaxID=661488 RepID=A0A4Q7N4T9_9BACT|nr:DUF1599 domain-containing protein [Pseudobacter ginsenosidimutans]QEC44551.1 DUF1599 domain-containing protein [Pseudobacter ginsenosidimutans]RZS76029.1 uncharacterized protein DUF1599 [Pseudobacter ginsenosidimutans]